MTIAMALPRPADRLVVIGVLNVTPDSFSDGGRHDSPATALRRGRELWAQGADLVDVGGESTRPGAGPVDAAEQIRRVCPVIEALAALGVPMSVDTTRAAVAAAALAAGASVINDASGGLADPDMARVASDAGCPWILTHWRGPSVAMAASARYRDVVAEVAQELTERVAAAERAGVDPGQLVIDPGLGFAKRPEHDLALLRQLGRLADLGLPVLVGASRKSFLGAALADATGAPRPVDRREAATVAVTAHAAAAGAWGVRVHEVAASLDAARVIAAIRAADGGAASGGALAGRALGGRAVGGRAAGGGTGGGTGAERAGAERAGTTR
ncbi:MAG: dihydropteroate synthase [Actinomycetia bacterium]|nr:dihydropteroate synthase [Actinomycetes bacterium]